jgi:hypothetical protein
MFDMEQRLSDKELDRVAALVPLVTAWVEAVNAEIFRRLESGVVMQNAVLVDKRPVRKWDDEKAILPLLEAMAPIDEVAPRVVISPTQAEKVLGRSRYAGLAEHVLKESSGKKVAYQQAFPFD